MGEINGEIGIHSKNLVWMLGVAGLISAADNWIISPVLPAVANTFAVSISEAGTVLTAYMIPYGLMQPVYGYLSDRCGKAKILRGIVCGLALGTLGCALAQSFWLLCLWRAVTGFFAAGIIAVSLALIGDSVPVSERQNYVGRFMGMVFLGQGISVGLGGVLAQIVNWRAAFALFALAALGTILLLRKLPSGMMNSSTGNIFAETKAVMLTPIGKVIFPLALGAGFLLLGLYGYLGAYLHEVIGLNYLDVGLVVMFYGFTCLFAGTWVGRLEARVGAQKTILFGAGLSLLCAFMLAFFPCWQAGWLATISLGAGYIFIQSTLATLAFNVSSENKGLPSALIGLGLFGGGGLGSAFCGLLLSYDGFQVMWLFVAAGIMLYMVLAAHSWFD